MPRFVLCLVIVFSASAAGCGSDGQEVTATNDLGTDETAGEPSGDIAPRPLTTTVQDAAGECGASVASGVLADAPQPSLDDMRAQLPLMRELHADTRVLADTFGIHPDHLMVNGLPTILIGTHDLGGQCREILDAVARPDLVRFVQWTEEDYSELLDHMPPWRVLITADAERATDGSEPERLWTSTGTGQYGITGLRLRSDQEALAAALFDRYGDLIELSVGNFPYPPERVDPSASSACEALPTVGTEPDIGIRAMTLRGGLESGQVEAVVGNDSESTVHLVPSRVAELTEVGSDRLVTRFGGAMTDEDRGSIRLDPGAATTVIATPSIAPCDISRGYALPPGAYEFVLPIHIFDAPASENDVSERVLLPRLEIELG